MTDIQARLLIAGAKTKDQMIDALVTIFRDLKYEDCARQLETEWSWLTEPEEDEDASEQATAAIAFAKAVKDLADAYAYE